MPFGLLTLVLPWTGLRDVRETEGAWRTPLAVVTTSLDNLEHEVTAGTAQQCLEGLREGTTRLDVIPAAMSEATQLEQAIAETVAEPVDLRAVVASRCNAYRDVDAERAVAYRCATSDTGIVGSGELVAKFHGGRCGADDLPDGSGVVVRVCFPRRPTA